jgi:hypothetical protein
LKAAGRRRAWVIIACVFFFVGHQRQRRFRFVDQLRFRARSRNRIERLVGRFTYHALLIDRPGQWSIGVDVGIASVPIRVVGGCSRAIARGHGLFIPGRVGFERRATLGIGVRRVGNLLVKVLFHGVVIGGIRARVSRAGTRLPNIIIIFGIIAGIIRFRQELVRRAAVG